jgi:HSP20 family protein
MTKFFTKINPVKSDEDDEFYPEDEYVGEEPAEEEDELTPEEVVRKEDWAESEPEDGQLSVDVYQTKDSVVIKSTIAGVKPEDVDISIENDVITIRGERKQESEVKDDDYFYQECYWGSFSRSIVLPVEVKSDETNASLKNGVLTVVLPKEKKSKSVAVKVKEE